MNAADLDEPVTIAIIAACAGAVGVAVGTVLLQCGMAQLEADLPRRLAWFGAATGLLGGVGGAFAVVHAGDALLLPGLLAWAYALAAAASCDALTQRVPTPLVRQAAVITAVLVFAASAVAGQWRWIGAAVAVSLATWLIFVIFWRFFGAGFGDVRLAVLGGLGLAHPTRVGFLVGVGVFVLITLSQALIVLARGGTRHSLLPFGPAISAAFLLAGAVQ